MEEKEINKNGCGSLRYCLITGLIYGIALVVWLYQAYLWKDGSINWAVVGVTILVWGFLLALALVPRKLKFRLPEKGQPVYDQIMLLLIAMDAVLIYAVFTTNESIVAGLLAHSLLYYFRSFVLLYGLTQLCYLLTNQVWRTGDIICIFAVCLAGVNYYVVAFRGSPVMPWDLGAFFTALRVMPNYSVVPDISVVMALLLMLIPHQLALALQVTKRRRSKKRSLITLALGAAVLIFYGFALAPTVTDTFWSFAIGYEENGMLPSFLHYLPYLNYDQPEGYDAQAAKEVLDSTEEVKADPDQTQAVNVIVIMNESFSDLRCINDGALEGDYMPFLDSLTENTIQGYLYVPSYGGNTCNTEFEFLTGSSYQYISGMPYLTFMKSGKSVNSILDCLPDFQTEAFHPYWRTNWARDVVYDDFGFDSFYDVYDIDVTEDDKLRDIVSDECDFDNVIRFYENKTGENYFMFNVTMQNHGGYTESFENMPVDADLSSYGDFPKAETYLTLVEHSDAAFEELVDYFSQVDEPTVICMFGDHQPQIETEFIETLMGKSTEEFTAEELQEEYMTRFVIWANYDIEEEEIPAMSANYLGMEVLKTANLDLDAYESYLAGLFEKYPVISSHGFIDSKGKYYAPDSGVDSEGDLLEYQQVQYYQLNNRNHEAK